MPASPTRFRSPRCPWSPPSSRPHLVRLATGAPHHELSSAPARAPQLSLDCAARNRRCSAGISIPCSEGTYNDLLDMISMGACTSILREIKAFGFRGEYGRKAET